MRGHRVRLDVGWGREGNRGVIPLLFKRLCDDAALFPPGNAPLESAAPQHLGFRNAPYADLAGPFVVPVSRVVELAAVPEPLELSITAPDGPATVLAALKVAGISGDLSVMAVVVTAPEGADLSPLREIDPSVNVYVEIPRGERRCDVLDAVSDFGFRAKFRTGGVKADMHPDEAELAEAIYETTRRGVAFKATAGLHHAARNTVSSNGFEQHGYLNLLVATHAAHTGARACDLATILAIRDANVLARHVASIEGPRKFLSFGT